MDERTPQGAPARNPGWPVTAATAVAAWGWMAQVGLTVDPASAVLPAGAAALLVGLARFYRHVRPDPGLAALLDAIAQLVVFTAAGAALSYAAARSAGPLWDETLHAWDRALGLDWRAYLAFVDERPLLGLAYTVAYRSILPQTILVVLALAVAGRIAGLRTFVLAFMIAGLACILISAAMPAMAMFVHLGLGPADFPNLDPAAAFVHAEAMNGLRDGALAAISLSQAEGIITFPSFHAALGIVFAWGFWQIPRLRWPGLAWNAVMIAATPIDGGHYFVDVFAGILVAAAALVLADRLVRGAGRARAPAAGLGRAPATGHASGQA